MAIPSVKSLSNVPGGAVPAVMNELRQKALKARMQQLKNQYYGPNIESEMNNRNALTEGQNITNKYMPEKLSRANEFAALENQYYGRNKESEINSRNELTKGQKFKNDNPLMNIGGAAGQVGSLMYLKKLKKEDPKAYEDMMERGIYPDDNAISPDQLLQQSIENSSKLKTPANTPTKEFKNAQGYDDAKAGFVPFTNRGQRVENPEQQKYFMDSLNSRENHKSIEANQEKNRNIKNWSDLTPETKSHLVAVGQGAGILGDEIRREMINGKSFNDILYDHGFDADHQPEPIYELTKKNQGALNEREYASREVKYLSNFITKATGEYANKIKGYNPAQVIDALKGRNDEQQARFLAARGLSPELINLRLVLGGAKSTVHAIQSMSNKSMLNNKIFESSVSNKVWQRTQEIMDKELQNAFKASKKGYGAPKKINTEKPIHHMTTEEIRAELGE